MKDTSKLTKKRITDRRGRSTTVWVKTGQADGSLVHDTVKQSHNTESEGKTGGGELTEKVDYQRALRQAKKDWTEAIIATRPWNEDGSDKSAEEVASLEKKASEMEKKFKKMERVYKKKYNVTRSPIQ